jgi:integrase
MKPNGPPKIYTKSEIEAFFKACKPDEELRYRSLYEPAFRKKELIYLEKEDVLVEQADATSAIENSLRQEWESSLQVQGQGE